MTRLTRKPFVSRHTWLAMVALIPGIIVFGTLKLRTPKDDSNIDAIPGLYVKERTVDLGNLMPDDVVDACFELANHGTNPIALEHVQSICGCTTGGDAEGLILPNKSLRIPVHFDASHALPTRFDKPILCKFSSPVAADVHLHLVGIISRSFWVTAFPDTLDFREVKLGSRSEHALYLFGGNDVLKAIPDEIVLGDAHVALPLDVSRSPTSVASKRVQVVLLPQLTRSPGKLAASIEFLSTSGSQRRTTLRVIADIGPQTPPNKE